MKVSLLKYFHVGKAVSFARDNSLDMMLSGKQFHDAHHDLTLCDETLMQFQIDQFCQWWSNEPEQLHMLKQLLDALRTAYEGYSSNNTEKFEQSTDDLAEDLRKYFQELFSKFEQMNHE